MPKTTSFLQLALLCFIYFYWPSNCSAQTETAIPVQSIISKIETTFDVRISYNPQDLEGIILSPPNYSLTLSQILKYLNQNSPLTFTQLDERYITVILLGSDNLLCGRIYNIETAAILEGATIVSNDGRFATLSNSEGIFYIPRSIDHEYLTIQHLGYEHMQINMKSLSRDCVAIYLLPSITQLENITLNTLFTKGIKKEIDGSVTINTRNFGLLPGQVENDVLLIVQSLPGVESVDETVSNINIRGGSHDENLILWDNIKMYQSGHFFGLISAFNPDLTKKVNLYKNGTPAKFGEAVSGVIAMYSQNTIADSFSGGAGFNLINANAFANIRLDENFSMQVSGRRSINSILETPVYNTFSERVFQDTEITSNEEPSGVSTILTDEDFKFYDFSTKLLWDLSAKDKIRVNFLTIDDSLEFHEMIEVSDGSKTSELRQESLAGGISWEHSWNEKIETSALAYGSYYLLDAINHDIYSTQELNQENEVLETGLKLDGSFILNEKISVEAGYHFSETGIANTQDVNLPRYRSYEKEVLQSHLAYGAIRYTSPNKQSELNAGIRTNYFQKFSKFLIEPRLSFHQKLGNGFALELAGELKNQSVTQRIDFDEDFLGVEKRRWVLANDETIPIIESEQVSLGLVYNKANWFVNLEGFYKNVDGITASNQGFQNQFQYVQAIGSYQASGVEFTLNRKSKSLSAWITYLYMKNDYTFETFTPSNFPNNVDIRQSLTLAGSYAINAFKLALGFNYHSGKPYTQPVTEDEIMDNNGEPTINYESPNSQRLSNYYRADFSTEYLWDISEGLDLKINFAIINLFDAENTLDIEYELSSDENGDPIVKEIEELSLGITPNFSLQFLF